MDPGTRRAALIATIIAVPLVVVLVIVLALVNSAGTNDASPTAQPSGTLLPAVTPSAPPDLPSAAADCGKLIAALPITLGSLAGRPSRPDVSYQTYTAAWGDPAVVLRCGVPRPATLVPLSSAQAFALDGVNVFEATQGKDNVFTVIDRPVYIDVSVPNAYPSPPIQPLMDAVAKTLTQVCTTQQVGGAQVPTAQLCTQRK